MTSQTKIQSNRRNSQGSTGPKTANGKNNIRRNAWKHGFYAKELVVSDAEKPEFVVLRRSLLSQLHPTTPLQDIAFEEILCCCWRCKLAARLEMSRLKTYLHAHDEQEMPTNDSAGRVAMQKWYGTDRQSLRDGIRLLQQLKDDFARLGRIDDSWKELLVKGFGPEFFELLTEWHKMSYDAILMADMLVGQSELLRA